MRSLVISTGVGVILLLGVVSRTFGDPLPPPFDTEPFDTDAVGNAGANLLGFFRQDGGPQQFRYFLGTNATPGSLTMDFAVPFTDGPGNDFAILTSSQSWGPLADRALFEFFLGGNLQASFIASLTPDELFQFDLPGSGLIADRVVVTNITPDPPGIDDLATMTFDNAGVAYDAQSLGSIMQVPTSGYIGFLFHQRLDSPFDCLEVNNAKRSHQGIDIWTNQEGKGTTTPSPKGHEVRAAHGGTLIAILDADNKSAVGTDRTPTSKASILVIDHGSIDGQPIYTLYAHMANAGGTETFLNPGLRLGQSIVKGALLGHQGNAFGKASPNSQMDGVYITHLHFEVKESAKAGKQVDPSPYIVREVNRCKSGYPGFLTPFP